MADYSYPLSGFTSLGDGKINLEALEVEVVEQGLIAPVASSFNSDAAELIIEFSVELSAGDEATLNGVIAAHQGTNSLEAKRQEKCRSIDRKTDWLIAQGFAFGGKVFSLSMGAQMKMVGITQVRNEAGVTYPIVWNTLNDDDTYSLADAATVLSFYLTGVGTYRAHVDSGTALKGQVRDATTIAEVEAVEDSR